MLRTLFDNVLQGKRHCYALLRSVLQRAFVWGRGLIIRRSQVRVLQGPYRLSSPTKKRASVSFAGTCANLGPSSIVVNGTAEYSRPKSGLLRRPLPLGLPRSCNPITAALDGEGLPSINPVWGGFR